MTGTGKESKPVNTPKKKTVSWNDDTHGTHAQPSSTTSRGKTQHTRTDKTVPKNTPIPRKSKRSWEDNQKQKAKKSGVKASGSELKKSSPKLSSMRKKHIRSMEKVSTNRRKKSRKAKADQNRTDLTDMDDPTESVFHTSKANIASSSDQGSSTESEQGELSFEEPDAETAVSESQQKEETHSNHMQLAEASTHQSQQTTSHTTSDTTNSRVTKRKRKLQDVDNISALDVNPDNPEIHGMDIR